MECHSFLIKISTNDIQVIFTKTNRQYTHAQNAIMWHSNEISTLCYRHCYKCIFREWFSQETTRIEITYRNPIRGNENICARSWPFWMTGINIFAFRTLLLLLLFIVHLTKQSVAASKCSWCSKRNLSLYQTCDWPPTLKPSLVMPRFLEKAFRSTPHFCIHMVIHTKVNV